MLPNRDMSWHRDNLGLIYYEGQGVIQDYTVARKWLQLSAGQDVPEAQFLLGWMVLQRTRRSL